MASVALSLADNFQAQIQAHPPTNCTSIQAVEDYLSSIVVTNSTGGEDGGVAWTTNGTATFYNGTSGQDNLTSLLTSAYSGYDKGEVNLVADVSVTESDPAVAYTKAETHHLHLSEPLSDVCSDLALLDGRMGVVVPLYADPNLSPQWAELVFAKIADPLVPVVAIINPADGPGYEEDPGFLEGVQALHQAGIAVLGYVDTAYGETPPSVLEQEVGTYHEWYGVDGIFLDDMNASDSPYYIDATADVRAFGMNYTMANPGSPVSDMGVASSIVEYEGAGLPYALPQTNMTVGAVIAYHVSELPPTSWFEAMHASGVGWVWLTDLGNGYFDLPTYLSQEMAMLSSLP